MADDELVALFAELAGALRDRDTLEAQLQRDPDDPLVRRLSLAACDRVLDRRNALYRGLIRQGWTPPPSVVRHLLEDEVIVSEDVGGVGG
ncbi:MAG TPA: hypothetical protein VNU26_10465 [Mycobacteriales bacterium]|nr:hypothetical protein [Mycobacteriales bacterium]